jgi:hypothetical protein
MYVYIHTYVYIYSGGLDSVISGAVIGGVRDLLPPRDWFRDWFRDWCRDATLIAHLFSGPIFVFKSN